MLRINYFGFVFYESLSVVFKAKLLRSKPLGRHNDLANEKVAMAAKIILIKTFLNILNSFVNPTSEMLDLQSVHYCIL
ncbi:MAG: hypothetical protein ACOVQ4_11090 [Flectobacillus sp.]|uniref:hypothetical protein n=1 Tax=Flectobacillus sp. TaxID=50419 RepID=UPI003B9D1AA7